MLFPHGRISDVQRRMMTTASDDNVHALAIEGTFDDCQAIVKGMFNHHAFRDRVRLSGVNSINWARIVAQVVYYFTAAVALGAPHRKVAFTVPTGNFGDIFAGYVAQRMGLPIDRLVIATNVNDILARTLATGTYELREVVPTTSPSMDIQVVVEFRAAAVRRLRPRRRRGARADGLARAVAALHAVGARAVADPRACSPPIAPTRTRPRPPSAPCGARPAISSIRTPPSASRWPKRKTRDPAVPMVVLVDRASGQISRRGRGGVRRAPALCRNGFPISMNGRSASTALPVDQAAVERFILSTSRAAQEGAAA